MEALRARYPRMRLDSAAGEAIPGTQYRAAWFRYATPGDETVYGALLAAWTTDTGRLVWTRDHRGDFPPHRLVWLDLDRDGRTDLFFTAGEETVLETFVFLQHGAGQMTADSVFAPAYVNMNAYVPLVDLDGDGSPELIEPLTTDDAEDPDYTGPCSESPPPPAVHRAAVEEYARIAGAWDAANVKFSPTDFAFRTLHLSRPVRILQLRDGHARVATADYMEHLRWRATLLEQYRAAAPDACRVEIDRVLRSLRSHGD